jgi:hypothetical protein
MVIYVFLHIKHEWPWIIRELFENFGGQQIYTNEQEIIINLNHNLNFKHSILVTVMVMVIVMV